MKIAVVILNWNGISYLKKFLPMVVANTDTSIAEVHVADNGSTDESVSFVRENFPGVKLLLLDKNYGFAGGYNQALAKIHAQYYVILNSDVELTVNWLEPMLSYLDNQPDVAACQPKVLSYNEKTKFEHAGAAGGFIDFLGYPFCRGRILDKTEVDTGQYDETVDIFWATGACMMIRAADFHNNGGFDACFFAHMEEIDLCWRLKSRGRRIVCVPQSVVFHVGGGTLHKENPRKTYLNFRNNQLMLYKNLPRKKFLFIYVLRFFLDYIAAFQLFVTGKPDNAGAVLRARRDFLKMKVDLKSKRIENLQKTTTSQIPEIFRGSLIVAYYFLKKRKFSEFFR